MDQNQINPLLIHRTKLIWFIASIALVISCKDYNESKNLSGLYFSGDDRISFCVYKIDNDEITKFNFQDSLVTSNYASVKENITFEEDQLTLKVNSKKMNLTKLDFNKLNSLDFLYDKYWESEIDKKKLCKRFFKEYSFSYDFYEQSNESRVNFWDTFVIGPYFNEFYFVRDRSFQGGFFLITALTREKLVLLQLENNYGDSIRFSSNNTSVLDYYGNWTLSDEQNPKVTDSLFKRFTISENGIGKLKNGAYEENEFKWFPSHDEKIFFLIINNESLNSKIVDFEIIGTDSIILQNNKILPGFDLKYMKE